jgi:DNA mismatch repair protein PMS2
MALNGAQEDLLLSYVKIFDKNGFSFSFDEAKEPGKRVSLMGVPRSKSLVFDESDVQELLWLLSDESTLNIENLRPSKVHRMFASRACRSAVMIGTALDFAQMRKIVDHMADMEHPWNCPHGRPTMRHVVDLLRIL